MSVGTSWWTPSRADDGAGSVLAVAMMGLLVTVAVAVGGVVGVVATHRTAQSAADLAALAGATVVSFCTGGVRCEKAALWMGDTGMANVLQLEGGILGYFEQVGGRHYDGACFVFDQRVALRPDLSPVAAQD